MAMCMLQSGESEQLVDMARCLSSPNLMLKASRVPGVLPLFSPCEGQRSRVLVLAKDNNNICSNGPNSRCTSQEVRRRASRWKTVLLLPQMASYLGYLWNVLFTLEEDLLPSVNLSRKYPHRSIQRHASYLIPDIIKLARVTISAVLVHIHAFWLVCLHVIWSLHYGTLE